MSTDDRTPEQQNFGQQNQQQSGQQQQQQPFGQQQQDPSMNDDQQDGSASTGQAAYGNSGETETVGDNSSSLGQESDIGQSGGEGSDSSLFRGSDDDTGGMSSDPTGQQDFADQGQGALDEDQLGSGGTNDIETERSQGRDGGRDGSNL